MYKLSAHDYDLLYSQKDYEREAHTLRERLWRIDAGLHSILDVACGTGAHDEILCQYYEVDGLDLHAPFLECARLRNPGGTYHEADMCDFRLDRMYDAILCLFGSIGYTQTYGHLVAALRCCRDHLTQRGVVIVEPWVEPERWQSDHVWQTHSEREGVHITRMTHGHRMGGICAMDFYYLIGSPAAGIIHQQERHELGLFTKEHIRQALIEAGLTHVDYDADGLGHGLNRNEALFLGGLFDGRQHP